MNRDICKSEIMRLSGMGNFPDPKENKEALRELVDTLASITFTQAEAKRIVSECLQASRFCPTPFDLRNMAADIRAKSNTWTPHVGKCSAGQCDGHGFAQAFFLVTEERRGEASFKRRERISPSTYAELARKVDGNTQRVYDAVEPCACKMARAIGPEAA